MDVSDQLLHFISLEGVYCRVRGRNIGSTFQGRAWPSQHISSRTQHVCASKANCGDPRGDQCQGMATGMM